MPSERESLMDRIYTKDKRINQSITVVPSEDVERAERRRAKRDKRRARRASSAMQREDIRISTRIAGRHVRIAERRMARNLEKSTRQRELERIVSSSLLPIGGT